jgi:hypothetical protein
MTIMQTRRHFLTQMGFGVAAGVLPFWQAGQRSHL